MSDCTWSLLSVLVSQRTVTHGELVFVGATHSTFVRAVEATEQANSFSVGGGMLISYDGSIKNILMSVSIIC